MISGRDDLTGADAFLLRTAARVAPTGDRDFEGLSAWRLSRCILAESLLER